MKGNVIGYRESRDKDSGNLFGYFVYLAENISQYGVGISSRGCFVSSYLVDRDLGGDISSIYHKDVFISERKNDKGTLLASDIMVRE